MTDGLKISVIIPCLNEAENLKELIPYLQRNGGESLSEIIVVDGGSEDNSTAIVNFFGVLLIHSPVANRATQLNLGAKSAKGNLLYFVHADTRPVPNFAKQIVENHKAIKSPGCFKYKFDSNSRLLQFNSWFTQFNGIFAGGGDQSLFIDKNQFLSMGGYNESFVVMEDFDLVRRIRQKTDFHVLPFEMTVSARKYNENNWLKVQLANFTAFSLFLLKVKPATIKSLYLNFLSQKN
ncbi:transferase 2, rSAM/selenodomain-associated [Algoriphagus locisalis]|uniref:Transferase 2, rSAM/selenodomain-associated n=1 Tax=Algoriphagus locisalis TaxID=305507 RepID=A0A1I6YIB8_9BACT|nr:TIGR04283 family arsenosugar biosynthesis glycosyltransferase [Algoriphagus locisalis]SFT50269.1 transferase 2, rSAM/selenodomain-associated [Algoriphagus locisalis]